MSLQFCHIADFSVSAPAFVEQDSSIGSLDSGKDSKLGIGDHDRVI